MMTPQEEIGYLCDRILELREQLRYCNEVHEERTEVNRGWVAYKYHVREREEGWRRRLATALGITDRWGGYPQLDDLVAEVCKQLGEESGK